MDDRIRQGLFWLAVLWLLVFTLPLQAGQDPFFFVQITDTHIGITENDQRTSRIIEAVNALPMTVECVVHTGDIYDRRVRKTPGAAARAAELFKPLHVPIYFLPGNNEIAVRKTGATEEAYTKNFSPLTYSREVAGICFVFAYSNPLRKGIRLDGFDPIQAVQGEMEKAGGKPVILFHHCPSVDDFYDNQFHPGWAAGTREKWLALIGSHNVRAVIAGHFHRDEFHWLGEVPLYVAGPVAEKFGRQAGFRIYQYQGGKLSYTTQYLE